MCSAPGSSRRRPPWRRSGDVVTTTAASASRRSSHLSGLPGRLVRRVFDAVVRAAPGAGPRLQRGLIRAGYALVSRVMRTAPDVTFLNFGYAALDGDESGIALRPEDQPDAYAIQLYYRVAGARDLRTRDVLEVGCGRGGGSSFIARYLHPRSVTGVDLAATAIRFCRRRHPLEGLTFAQGNAEDLPFDAGSFDVVVNVESSHCYPSFERFLAEVARVLRPGGVFLIADLRPAEQVARMREQLGSAFTIVDEECITPNVFRALELFSERRSALIRRAVPTMLRRAMRNFAAVEGTPTFEAFRRRELEYLRFVLQKRD
jgi:SAM-dependent methyltransferase